MGRRLGGRLDALKEDLQSQATALVNEGKVKDPHPYFAVWLMCRNLQGDGPRILPDAGGVLDQNWELMWAFDILDAAYANEKQIKENFTTNAQSLKDLRNQLLAGMKK